MPQTIAILGVLVFAALGICAGLRIPVRPTHERLNLLRTVGFSFVGAVAACFFGKSVIDSASTGITTLSSRLGWVYEIAASPFGFYFVSIVKLVMVLLLAMISVYIVRIYRSQT
jgi:hypothetical protein